MIPKAIPIVKFVLLSQYFGKSESEINHGELSEHDWCLGVGTFWHRNVV